MRNPAWIHQLHLQQQQEIEEQRPQTYPPQQPAPAQLQQLRYQEAQQHIQAQSPQQLPSRQPSRILDLRTFATTNRVSLPHYEAIRKEFHSHPELSGQERETARRIAHYLTRAGVHEIHTGIGGHGVAAVLKNGSGPTILLRSDSDGLPVREQTGLAYASTRRQIDADGKEKPVMHACGHDVHMTCLLATAETLVKARDSWAGTVIFVFQPAEEHLAGAKAMVKDGLYKKVPVPDVLLGQHVFPDRAGYVGMRAGPTMAAADSLKITFYGRGAHASQPQNSVDPVVMASSAVVRLQTVVSREVSPLDTAVVTVSAIHGGEAENIIESEAFIRVNVRTFKPEVREKVLAGIERIVKAEARASGAEREPIIEATNSGPAIVNDAETTQKLTKAFAEYFGERFEGDREPVMGSEDFCGLASAIGKPSVFWFFGGTDQKKYDDAKKTGRLLEEIPANHSPFFAPAMRPTLETGIDAMVTAAMTFVGKK